MNYLAFNLQTKRTKKKKNLLTLVTKIIANTDFTCFNNQLTNKKNEKQKKILFILQRQAHVTATTHKITCNSFFLLQFRQLDTQSHQMLCYITAVALETVAIQCFIATLRIFAGVISEVKLVN